MRGLFGVLILCVLAVGLLAPSIALAEDRPPTRLSVRDDSGETRVVSAGVYLIDIVSIDTAERTMRADFNLTLTWHDDALVGRWDDVQEVDASAIWAPEIQIVNGVALVKTRADVVEVWPDGTAFYPQRYVGDLSIPVDISDFPSDSHVFGIDFISVNRIHVEFVPDEEGTAQRASFTVPDWAIGPGSVRVAPVDTGFDTLPGFTYEFPARRHVAYYFWKIILPLAMIVFMSWTVFWIDPARIEAQLAVGATSMLTMITFRFTFGAVMPRVSYQTRLDVFVFVSTVFIFLALVESVTTSRLAGTGRERLGLRIDALSRWLFPLAYALLVVWIFVSP